MTKSKKLLLAILLLLPLAGCAGLLVWLAQLPQEEHSIASFATSLRHRTTSQVHNARLAAAALNGAVIPSGREFSFNQTVGPWTADLGYLKAPVSYSGDPILDWGGGVCQTSTTLYNTALLSGMTILERHRHHWPAKYAPVGQDAAVAFPNIDLRFRNDLEAPVRISARISGDLLVVELFSRAAPPQVSLENEIIALTPPATVIEVQANRSFSPPTQGQPGYEVVVYRKRLDNSDEKEIISRDTYPPRNRVIWR